MSGYGALATEDRDMDEPFGFGSRQNGNRSGFSGPSLYGDLQGLCDVISSNIFKINSSATSLDRALKQIGTPKDSIQLRDRIHDTELNANRVTSDTTRAFKQLSTLCSRSDRQQKLQYERLMGEFQETVKRYHGLQKKVAERVKSATPLRSPAASGGKVKDLIGWGEDDASEDARLLEEEKRQQEQEQLQAQEEMLSEDLALLQEREERIRQFEGDILDIRDIFNELAMLVNEQGETIDTIEANVESAHGQVTAGREQLTQAAKYQRKARKKMCILVVILLIIAAVLALVIYLSLKK